MGMHKTVRVAVPATTANMGPGFDCLGMALNLYNEIYMSISGDKLSIEVEGEGAMDISRDEQNIVYRAARRVYAELGQPVPGLTIKLVNKIPTSRGLGSSAAAIVGGLTAANRLTGERLSQERLLELATELEGHPDNVAPALLGGIVISVLQDSKVHYLRIDPPAGLNTVVAIPDFPLSTRAAREVLPQRVSLQEAVFNLSRAALLVGALCEKRLDLLQVAGQDVLHQPHRANLVPGMKEVMAAARQAGALNVTLSGAGPTVIALTCGAEEAVAASMQHSFKQAGVNCHTKVLIPTIDGAQIIWFN
ncbi:Homoserine kinase [Desulfotomaculum nigrificans CO-1-SRB]|uniref:Homoserine kinase n=1 Tax=Desulfotomaculum nigrificans (strain DSM 14880 / VKM B-2319 / CO-1-SRB) TaxID=868595 RepID=F6B967_DESCC|nr:homoserine kinase [Desulfotomaculum nigrificans]AEF94839.1 Homoserine kinase [Desulfotomaculum nigrificans CO-1-SRB]